MFDRTQRFLTARNRLFFGLILSIISLTSFWLYSAWFSPLLDADNAIHVLMAQNFVFPDDLYYWGQDRRGSLEPAISSVLIQISSNLGLPSSPLFVLSIIQFLLAGTAFFALSSFLRSYLAKTIFALIWFLPPMWFQTTLQLGHPYYAQLACFGIGLWGVSLLEKQRSLGGKPLQQKQSLVISLISLTVISFFGSLWISELSAFLLLILLVRFQIGRIFLKPRVTEIQSQESVPFLPILKPWKSFTVISIWTFFCVLFIKYAKDNANQTSEYKVIFASGPEIFENLQRLGTRLWSLLSFQAPSGLVSVSLVGLITLLILLLKPALRLRRKYNWAELLVSWKVFFGVCFISLLIFLIVSKWIYLNGTHPRYFALPFTLATLSLLMALEDWPKQYCKRALSALVLLATSSALSVPVYIHKYRSFKPVRSQLEGFRNLPHKAFIGDYWTSYLICSVDPANLDCTPHDKSFIRCESCIDEVLSDDKTHVYLIRDLWLDQFPETIVQFGRTLVRDGETQMIEGYTFTPYLIDGLVNNPETP